MKQTKRLPLWLRRDLKYSSTHNTNKVLTKFKVKTVCEQARCPNKNECFSLSKATFIILGDICSRNCKFCAISNGVPQRPDLDEPNRIAMVAHELNLKHIVITSVTRDDLGDGGAEQFVATIKAIREKMSNVTIEVLVPDFCGNLSSIDKICQAGIDVFNHNMETVERLYPHIRPQANYRQSLNILHYVADKYRNIYTKSGFMLGLGEDEVEVYKLIGDLCAINMDIITIGQYLKPKNTSVNVSKYISPDEFLIYEKYALNKGCKNVYASPYVRSSYNADKFIKGDYSLCLKN